MNNSVKPYYLSLYEKAMPDSMTLGEKWALARRCGYDGLELSVDETDERLSRVLDPGIKEKTISEISSCRIPIRTMCLSGLRRFPPGSRDPDKRKKSVHIIRCAIDFARETGIRVIQIPGYDVWYEKRGSDTAAFFLDGLREVVPYAALNGVILAFETMENEFMNTAEKAMVYLKEISSPYLQVYPDIGNIRNGTDDPIGDLKAARGYIAAAHLKETAEGVFRNLEFGQGRVDFVGCLRELLGQNVGIFNCEFWYDGKSDPADLITRNRRYIEKCFDAAMNEEKEKCYLLGIDSGGTVCKAAVFDTRGRQILKKSIQIPLTVNENGRTERNMLEIAEKTVELIRRITSELDGKITAVGLSGHGKGLYLLDKTGKPLGNGIGSTDSRALEIEKSIRESGLEDTVYKHTFQKVLACQPVCLLKWLKEKDRSTYDRIGTVFSVKDYIGYVLTGEIKAELTDMSGTNLVSLAKCDYDPSLTDLFGIPEVYPCLPPLIRSFDVRGHVTKEAARKTGLPEGIPVSGGMFDIDACALGAGTFNEGDLCMIAGTWSINEYISRTPVRDAAMNSFWCVDGFFLAEESSAASAGNLEWMRQILKDKSYSELDALVEGTPADKNAVLFFPFLFSSNLVPYARASLIGLDSGCGEGDVIRAIYEGVVFSGYTHLERLLRNMKKPPAKLKLAGGVVNSPVWTQMFADIAGIPVEAAEKTELGCKGAAISAGIASGIFRDASEAVSLSVEPGVIYYPNPEMTEICRRKYAIYRQAEECLRPVWREMKDFRES